MDAYQKARNEVLYAIQVLAKPRITRDERKFLQTLLHGVAEDLERLREEAAKDVIYESDERHGKGCDCSRCRLPEDDHIDQEAAK